MKVEWERVCVQVQVRRKRAGRDDLGGGRRRSQVEGRGEEAGRGRAGPVDEP